MLHGKLKSEEKEKDKMAIRIEPSKLFQVSLISLIIIIGITWLINQFAPGTIPTIKAGWIFFLFGLVSMPFYFLGWIFYLPVWLGLAYLVKIIDIFSSIPFASLGMENIHWLWLLVSYLILILGLVVWRLKKCYN